MVQVNEERSDTEIVLTKYQWMGCSMQVTMLHNDREVVDSFAIVFDD